MKTLWWKLSILYHFIKWAIVDWRANVWKRHPDECYCCRNIECDCGGFIAGAGMTVRQVYDAEIFKSDGYIQMPSDPTDMPINAHVNQFFLEHTDD